MAGMLKYYRYLNQQYFIVSEFIITRFSCIHLCFTRLFFAQFRGTGALVISSMLDFLTFALCAPYSETTDGTYFDNLLEMVANDGRVIFRLFQVSNAHEIGLRTSIWVVAGSNPTQSMKVINE